mmetsp:Transcript_31128/g.73890  ORF Transcript_31128/g.73890 Transcript_31128/m.73890 type:complete len:296 (-) Transcript_31128:292-1179(-)
MHQRVETREDVIVALAARVAVSDLIHGTERCLVRRLLLDLLVSQALVLPCEDLVQIAVDARRHLLPLLLRLQRLRRLLGDGGEAGERVVAADGRQAVDVSRELQLRGVATAAACRGSGKREAASAARHQAISDRGKGSGGVQRRRRVGLAVAAGGGRVVAASGAVGIFALPRPAVGRREERVRDVVRRADGALQRRRPEPYAPHVVVTVLAHVLGHPRGEALCILAARLGERRVTADLTEQVVLRLAMPGEVDDVRRRVDRGEELRDPHTQVAVHPVGDHLLAVVDQLDVGEVVL